jgi:hypothetical protein
MNEICTHPDAHRQHIVPTVATKVEGATTQGESYAGSQSVVRGREDLPRVHAKHRVKTAAHVARFAVNAQKLGSLQGIGPDAIVEVEIR